MGNFDTSSQQRLINSLDYEAWLIDFLAMNHARWNKARTGLKLRSGESTSRIELSVGDTIGGSGEEFINAFTPLTFTATYKILDMIYLWVLQENQPALGSRKIPWRFSERIELLKSSSLTYPPLFAARSYLREYTFALYTNLLPYRNEIVHDRNFSIVSGILEVTDTKTGNKLQVNVEQLGYLGQTVLIIVRSLTGQLVLDEYRERCLRFYLDHLAGIHRKPVLGQLLPLIIDIELTVSEQAGVFPINLRWIREQAKFHPNADVLFNLTVVGELQNGGKIDWYFPLHAIPNSDSLNLTPQAYPEMRQGRVSPR